MTNAVFTIALIDIVEQDEVLRYFAEALQKIQHRHSDWSIIYKSFQLFSAGSECDYFYSEVQLERPFQHLFIHTKTLKGLRGVFKDELWFKKVLGTLNLDKPAHIWFYSGDIEEFKEHLKWLQRRSLEPLFPEYVTIRCLDVFDLLYPPQDEEMDLWLENIFKSSITAYQ